MIERDELNKENPIDKSGLEIPSGDIVITEEFRDKTRTSLKVFISNHVEQKINLDQVIKAMTRADRMSDVINDISTIVGVGYCDREVINSDKEAKLIINICDGHTKRRVSAVESYKQELYKKPLLDDGQINKMKSIAYLNLTEELRELPFICDIAAVWQLIYDNFKGLSVEECLMLNNDLKRFGIFYDENAKFFISY